MLVQDHKPIYKKLRWGVLGCANIAIKSVIPAIQQSETGYVLGIASRNLEKAQETADHFQIERVYSDYQALLQDPEIDAVYIPLPNHLHYEWTIKAAQYKKHVLCEKPLSLNLKEAKEMLIASQQNRVYLAEAFMYAYHPRYTKIKEIINSGDIGEIRGIHGTFTFNNASDVNNVRFQSQMGGGALYDVGCYPIHAARFLLETEPEAVTVHAFFSPQHDHVDMMASGLLEFPNGISLTFDCGMWADRRNTLQILGTEGRIEIPSAFICRSHEDSRLLVLSKGEKQKEILLPFVNQYTLQVDQFALVILTEEPPLIPTSDSVRNMHVLEACLKSAKERLRVTL
ncbi:Gfo/Idh/MocA family protein [Ammoniphilus resinae]|uniref:Dehydrogenase n=1 Tax=Ammoniphilus resinae TaxID=861532 RepID=A0ABS4GM52_9BACL|nr:Gfo/Idh/MocA family oxidoreductase [Ammoniphilus resinae]MBP1931348.1 putative dehydrogenase [Ammoniphilus resinae]